MIIKQKQLKQKQLKQLKQTSKKPNKKIIGGHKVFIQKNRETDDWDINWPPLDTHSKDCVSNCFHILVDYILRNF